MTLILQLLLEEEAALREQARQEGRPAEVVAHALVRGGLHQRLLPFWGRWSLRHSWKTGS